MQVFSFITVYFKRFLNSLGIKDNMIFLRISVCLLFGLLPFRLLGALQLNLYPRIVIGLFFVFLTFYFSQQIIPALLATKIFQICFYFGLVIDEHFKSLRPIFRISIFFFVVLTLIFSLIFIKKAYFLSAFCISIWSLYKSLKANFVNTNSVLCFVAVRTDPSKRDYFLWFDIIQNMTLVCYFLFNKALVPNKLDDSIYNRRFRYLTRGVFPVYSLPESKAPSEKKIKRK